MPRTFRVKLVLLFLSVLLFLIASAAWLVNCIGWLVDSIDAGLMWAYNKIDEKL